MAGYLSRSTSLSPLELSPSSPELPGSSPAAKKEMTSDVRLIPDIGSSPLKIFVLAKKKINDVFVGIQNYVEESNNFISELTVESSVVSQEMIRETFCFKERVAGIKDVLARDHMKVVFFGRTSNGKSSVINALLQDKILPSGLGHTTNCFLQVEGADTLEPYILTEEFSEPQNIQGNMANVSLFTLEQNMALHNIMQRE